MYPSSNLAIFVLCALWVCALQAGDELRWFKDGVPPDAIRETAMPDTGDSRVGKILSRFYNKGLGGPENWEEIISMRSKGEIHLADGESMEMEAYQRKPDRMKVILRNKGRAVLTLSYDGESAWRQYAEPSKVQSMDATEARRFIHSSMFGNHLLFPFAEGKKIEYLETIPIEQKVCHKLRVHLDTGYQVDYYIDVTSYHERMVENVDRKTDKINTIHYREYSMVSGMPMAMVLENFEDNKLVSTLELKDCRVNAGIMPWMFDMPEVAAGASVGSKSSVPAP